MKTDFPKMTIEQQHQFIRRLYDTAGSEQARFVFGQILDSLVRLEYLESKNKSK